MSDPQQQPTATKESRVDMAREELRSMARWKKIMLAGSLGFVAFGIVLALVEQPAGAITEPGPDGSIPPGGSALIDPSQVPGQDGGTVPASVDNDPWSAGFFRLGFGFFAGFCVGFAARKTLKLLAFAAGLTLLLLFVLSYAELLTVNWTAIDDLFSRFIARLEQESGAFRTFVMGSLPAASLMGVGLYAGFKKN